MVIDCQQSSVVATVTPTPDFRAGDLPKRPSQIRGQPSAPAAGATSVTVRGSVGGVRK